MKRNHDAISFILRRTRVGTFAYIIRNVTIFITTIFKDAEKVKRIRNYVSKYNLWLYF